MHGLLLFALAAGEAFGEDPPRVANRESEIEAVPASAAGATTSAGASDDARAAARGALAEGNRRLRAGDVAGAIGEYRRAQRAYPPAAARVEFNVAKAEEVRGDDPAAAAAFERFLSQSIAADPAFRDEARSELRRLSASLGAVQLVETRRGLVVAVDGQPRAETPVDTGMWVRPGRHLITVEDGKHELFRDYVEVDMGSTIQLKLTIGPVVPSGSDDEGARRALSLAPVDPSSDVSGPDNPRQPHDLYDVSTSRPAALASRDTIGSTGADRPSLWSRWWLWTAIGVASAVAVGAGALVLSGRHDGCAGMSMCSEIAPPPRQ